jgi:DNA-binding response OmpR family regulator
MSSPINQSPEEDTIAVGRAIGDSLAGNTDPNLPLTKADVVRLTKDEEMLLGILHQHVGQALSLERLTELAAVEREAGEQTEGRASAHELSASNVARTARSLDRKLTMIGSRERIREVAGVGYILWR